MKTTLVVFLTSVFLFVGCSATYTISSNDLLNTGKRIITKGQITFRPAKLTIINPYSNTEFSAVIDGNVVMVPARSYVCVDVCINLLPDGMMMPIPIAIVPPNDSFNSEAQNWNVQSYGSSSSVWVIQVSGNWISLRRSS
jgi:hypothetical protein